MLEKFGLIETKTTAVAVGETYGRLTVIAVGQKPRSYRKYAICKCSCGHDGKTIRTDSLKDGSVSSCGCLQREVSTKHHQYQSVHYKRWINMIDRCDNINSSYYYNYGGRGISVCPQWYDINQFIKDLPGGYYDGLEMDRINNDGNYEPGNIRWATKKVNNNNRSTCKEITHRGVTQNITKWSEQTGLPVKVISARILAEWDADAALTKPIMTSLERMRNAQKSRWENHTKKPKPKPKVVRTVEYNGEILTTADIAKLTGKTAKLIYKQLFERGWDIEKVMKQVVK